MSEMIGRPLGEMDFAGGYYPYGSVSTGRQLVSISNELRRRGWKIVAGGGYFTEESISPPGGGHAALRADLTATKNGRTLRIQTVDASPRGIPAVREKWSARIIRLIKPNDHMILIPKSPLDPINLYSIFLDLKHPKLIKPGPGYKRIDRGSKVLVNHQRYLQYARAAGAVAKEDGRRPRKGPDRSS